MSNAIRVNGCDNYNASIYTRENAERALHFLESNNLKAIDADTFEQIKDILDKVEVDPNSKIQGPLKTVLVALSLAGASALTASTLTGKGLAFLQKNTKLVDKLGVSTMDLLAKTKKHLKKNPDLKTKSFKGTLLRCVDNSVDWIDNLSKKGIEDTLKNIKGKGSVAKKVNEQGKNLVSKTAKTVAAVGVGGKTLKETTIDKDKNGIADIQESGKNDATSVAKKLAEAVIASVV